MDYGWNDKQNNVSLKTYKISVKTYKDNCYDVYIKISLIISRNFLFADRVDYYMDF